MAVDRGVTIGYFSQDVGDMSGRSAVSEVMDGAGPVRGPLHHPISSELTALWGRSCSDSGPPGTVRAVLRRAISCREHMQQYTSA